ncbi:MAG: DUF1653 domain-containing protein [Patescibacteria group bacterium]
MEHNIKPGQIYKHFKGDTYKIITLAKNTETEEWMVVYERQTDLNSNGWRVWARPLDMFLENVEREDYRGPRFTYLG